MKKIKFVFFAVLAATLLTVAFMCNSVAEVHESFTYEVRGEEIAITNFDRNFIGEVVIPDTIEGKPVVFIADYAFAWCAHVTSLTIPETVTSIGEYGFYECERLVNISIPGTVTEIGTHAFEDCRKLTSVTLPDGVTTIADYMFYLCSELTSVRVSPNLTAIGCFAFGRCDNLSTIDLPDGVTSIGDYAFLECRFLDVKTHIPKGLTSIGDGVFSYCNTGYFSIPEHITSIGKYAFYGCFTFSLYIPASVTFIDEGAFACNGYLFQITLAEDNPCYDLVDEVLFDKSHTRLLCYPSERSGEEYTIPEGVTRIGAGAFTSCGCLAKINIPDSVTSIGDYAFAFSLHLTEEITIPRGVTRIGHCAFETCTRLTSVQLPDSITSIGPCAFDGCRELKQIYYEGTQEQWGEISIELYNEHLSETPVVFSHRHSYIATVTPPTCEEKGYTTYTCTVSGHSYVDDIVSCTGHRYIKWTSNGDGTHTGVCANNPEHKKTEGCHYKRTHTDATCETEGKTVGECYSCGHVRIDDFVPPLGHKYICLCTNFDGTHTEICQHDENHVRTVECTYDVVVVPPTCSDEGYTCYTCTVCGDINEKNYIFPTDEHEDKDFDNVCDICGKQYASGIQKLINFFNRIIYLLKNLFNK